MLESVFILEETELCINEFFNHFAPEQPKTERDRVISVTRKLIDAALLKNPSRENLYKIKITDNIYFWCSELNKYLTIEKAEEFYNVRGRVVIPT